jgi:hypothetical protein
VTGVNYIAVDDNYIDRKSGLIINIISSLFLAVCWLLFCVSNNQLTCSKILQYPLNDNYIDRPIASFKILLSHREPIPNRG